MGVIVKGEIPQDFSDRDNVDYYEIKVEAEPLNSEDRYPPHASVTIRSRLDYKNKNHRPYQYHVYPEVRWPSWSGFEDSNVDFAKRFVEVLNKTLEIASEIDTKIAAQGPFFLHEEDCPRLLCICSEIQERNAKIALHYDRVKERRESVVTFGPNNVFLGIYKATTYQRKDRFYFTPKKGKKQIFESRFETDDFIAKLRDKELASG